MLRPVSGMLRVPGEMAPPVGEMDRYAGEMLLEPSGTPLLRSVVFQETSLVIQPGGGALVTQVHPRPGAIDS
jgi:hypothetical protein